MKAKVVNPLFSIGTSWEKSMSLDSVLGEKPVSERYRVCILLKNMFQLLVLVSSGNNC